MSKDLFTIEGVHQAEGSASATLLLNAGHPILQGHFPGQPVVPGACLVQVVKEVMQQVVNARLLLNSAPTIKFISMLVPGQHLISRLTVNYKTADEGKITFGATIIAGNVVCFKIQGSYCLS